VIRRLVDAAGIHRSAPKVRSSRSRRRATDQHLTIRAEQFGFSSLQAHLADRVTQRAWTLVRYHAPKARGAPAAMNLPALGGNSVVYRDIQGHLDELWKGAGGDRATGDATANGGAPPAAGDPSIYQATGTCTR
jgi:hypothetical protein